ncbi:hypothetical protein LLEC1_01158 [Akanthomyces lecanii]|uniref:Hydrophobic surface binding protein A n=1 Tax=Cordyceps confragosa TaxID=2714763 RepID=A0A179I9Q7_CORDF|nr:hypothetical protein LLEC1_01158 [Akanthomyces lecanii]
MVAIAKFLWLALTVTAATIRRDVITVQDDITKRLGPQLSTLSKDVKGFPGSGVDGALAIQADFKTLTATFKTATSNVKATGSFGVVSGTTILSYIQVNLVPTTLHTLVSLQDQVSAWADVEGGKALVLAQLKELNSATSTYFYAITAAEPLLQKSGAIAIQTQISGAFTTAIGVYAKN